MGWPIFQQRVFFRYSLAALAENSVNSIPVKFLNLHPEKKKKIDEYIQSEKKKSELSGFQN
jgi:hypothetical protein